MPGIGRIVGKAAAKKAREASMQEVADAAMRATRRPPSTQRVDGTEVRPGVGLPATAVTLGGAGAAKMLHERRQAKKRK